MEEAPIRSVPTEATRTLAEVAPEPQIAWTELTEVFPTVPAALPTPLAGLTPGMPGAAAREVLDRAHQKGVPVIAEPHAGGMSMTTLLAEHENVGLTLLLDEQGAALHHLDVSLPEAEAVPMLSVRWGNPSSLETDAAGQAVYRWEPPAGGVWRARLNPPADGKAVLSYEPVTP